mgnify:CR=1 FL=1
MMAPTHRTWWETGKSVLLVVLVALSLILTWLSWNYRPPYRAAEKQYTAMPPLGEEEELEHVVIPELIVFHRSGEHRLALPFTPAYRKTLDTLSQWPVSALTPVTWEEMDWRAMRRGTGMELNYGIPVPLVDLPWFDPADGTAPADVTVHRVWLVDETVSVPGDGDPDDGAGRAWDGKPAAGALVLYLLDDERQQAYRAPLETEAAGWKTLLESAADLPLGVFYPTESGTSAGRAADDGSAAADRLSASALETSSAGSGHVAVEHSGVQNGERADEDGAGEAAGSHVPVLETGPGVDGLDAPGRDGAPFGWYLPHEAPLVDEEVWQWEPIPLSSLYPYLFVDPTYIREIVTRDGVLVYTDGSRSLQVEPSRWRMIYDAPAFLPPSGREADDMSPIRTAVQFINQYGGWIGQYGLDGVRQFTSDHVRLLFRYYHGLYPVYASIPGGEDARMEFSTQTAGTVTTLERPFYRLAKKIQAVERRLPDGEAVYRQVLDLQAQGRNILRIRLAYRMEMAMDTPEGESPVIHLVPDWVLVDADGRFDWLQATVRPAGDD